MNKPTLNRFVSNDINNEMNIEVSQVILKALGRYEAKLLAGLSAEAHTSIETPLQANIENKEPLTQLGVKCVEEAVLSVKACENAESASSASSKARTIINFDSRFQKERQARLRAEAKLRQLQIEFSVLAKRTEQAALNRSAADYARLLALEAADLHAVASSAARVEAERKLKAEQVATELINSQAEADRNAWQLQEQANVLLRKAEQKSQERLATETMASKAAAFKLQAERSLAVLAEQLANAELQSAHEVEIKLREETRKLALSNERLEIMQLNRHNSGLQGKTETLKIAEAAHNNNKQAKL